MCASIEKLGFTVLFLQRDHSIGSLVNNSPFLVTAHFSRPPFINPAISLTVTWVPPPGHRRAGPEREGACEVGVPRGQVADIGPSLGLRIYLPQPNRSKGEVGVLRTC